MQSMNKGMLEGMAYARRIFAPLVQRITAISDYEKERLLTYFSRCAAEESYFMVELWALLGTTLLKRGEVKAILVRKTILSPFIRDLCEKENYQLSFYRSFFLTTIICRPHYVMDAALEPRIVISISHFWDRIKMVIRGLIFSFLRRLRAATPKKTKSYPICAMVFNQHASDLYNCLPWAIFPEESSLKKEVLILSPTFLGNRAKEYYKKGDDFLEYDFNFCGDQKDHRLKKTASLFFDFFLKNIYSYRALFGLSKSNRYLLKHLLMPIFKVSFFEALFSAAGSRILWTMNEDDFDTQFAAIAMHRRGGVSLGTSWSQILLPSWNIQRNQYDIFFSWGKRMVDIGRKTSDQNYYFVITGYPADHFYEEEIQKAKEFRFHIQEVSQKNMILTVVDNKAANDIMFSQEARNEVYEGLFSWLDRNDKNFLVIKTKDRHNLKEVPSLQKRIDFFEKRRKLSIIDERGALYPGLAADVVVGIASVSLISLLATLGVSVIFLDSHRLLNNFPLGLPNVKTILGVDELIPAVEGILKEKKLFPSRHRHSRASGNLFLKGYSIDSFADGKSGERIRFYMENLLEGYKRNVSLKNKDILDYANQKYMLKWGKENVVKGILSELALEVWTAG